MQRLWDDRLVEVWASPGKAGTGVAIGDVGVLTARHLVADAFRGGEVLARVVRPHQLTAPWTAMRVGWEEAGWDIALLLVGDQVALGDGSTGGKWQMPTSGFPGLVRLGTAHEKECEAVGFPDSAVQKTASGNPSDDVRQSEQVVGTLLPAGQGKPPQHPDRTLPLVWLPFDDDVKQPTSGSGWQGIRAPVSSCQMDGSSGSW